MMDSELVPAWLTTSLIEEALREGLKCSHLKIIKSDIKRATAFGENFGSRMFRYELTIEKVPQSIHEKFFVIAKIMPLGKFATEIEKLSGFKTEGKAYEEVLPTVSSYLKEAYPEEEKLYPELYYRQVSPNHLLLIEDLRPEGFIVFDRYRGLDLEHTKMVIRSLAKIQAASIVINLNGLIDLKSFNYTWDNDLAVKILKNPFSTFLKNFRKWPNFERKEMYLEKLECIEKTFMEKISRVWRMDESKVNVLLHGDVWNNNIMFKYGPDGSLSKVKFVDFQLMTLNSPVLDLYYFIFSSVRKDFRFRYFDDFLKEYHRVFEETLKKLGFGDRIQFPLEEFLIEAKEKLFWGFAVFYTVAPMVNTRIERVLDVENLLKNDHGASLESFYKNEDLRKAMIEGLKFFEDRGVL